MQMQFCGHAVHAACKVLQFCGPAVLRLTCIIQCYTSVIHLTYSTSHLSPLTSHLSPLTSHLSPLISFLPTFHPYGMLPTCHSSLVTRPYFRLFKIPSRSITLAKPFLKTFSSGSCISGLSTDVMSLPTITLNPLSYPCLAVVPQQ